MKKTTVALAACALLAAAPAVAGPMKAGLWEMTMKMEGVKMPTLSPEQMEKMRQMGVKMPQMQNGGIATQVCITKEMADRDEPPHMGQNQAGCQVQNYRHDGNAYSLDMVCDSERMKGTGSVKGTFSGNESFVSTVDFKGTASGHAFNQHHETIGRWVSADCGAVQPAAALPKK